MDLSGLISFDMLVYGTVECFSNRTVPKETRSCYEGCSKINPHFFYLCERFEGYYKKCLTNKRLTKTKNEI